MLFGKALVMQSSGAVLFYKKNDEGRWEMYHKLARMRGQLHHVEGMDRM